MAADISGFNSMLSHFDSGRFGMVYTGPWAIILLRPRGTFELAAAEGPQDGLPNSELSSAMVGVYAGSRYPQHAIRLLQFLASDRYNRMHIPIPPVPYYATTEAYLRPYGRENEWLAYQAFASATAETGITVSKSPFVLQSTVVRLEREAFELMIAGRLTPTEAAALMADRINSEIQINLQRNPSLGTLYEKRLELQRRITEKRARGERVPAAWVTDAFHRAYYREHGWLEEELP